MLFFWSNPIPFQSMIFQVIRQLLCCVLHLFTLDYEFHSRKFAPLFHDTLVFDSKNTSCQMVESALRRSPGAQKIVMMISRGRSTRTRHHGVCSSEMHQFRYES